jgi:hypothetical protein
VLEHFDRHTAEQRAAATRHEEQDQTPRHPHESPSQVLGAAQAELGDEAEAADDDREPARPACSPDEPETGQADDDAPERRDPAPRREVETMTCSDVST